MIKPCILLDNSKISLRRGTAPKCEEDTHATLPPPPHGHRYDNNPRGFETEAFHAPDALFVAQPTVSEYRIYISGDNRLSKIAQRVEC